MWAILQPRKSAFLLILSDLVTTCLLLWLAAELMFPESLKLENLEAIMGTFPWICIAVVSSALLMDLYHTEGSFSRYNVFLSAVIAAGLTVVISGGASFFLRFFAFPRSVMLLFGLLLIIYFYLSRWAYHRLERGRPGACFVTQEEYSEGKLDELNLETDTIVIQDFMDMNLRKQAIVESVKHCRTLRVEVTPTDILLHGGNLISRDGRIYIEVTPGVGQTQFTDLVKRIFDLVIALAALPICLPLIALIAAVVWLDSGAPVFYTQERVTMRGRLFRIYKFRTMIPDAERHTGPVLASEKDPRLTRVGTYLRYWRLDELPQIWNVIRGDMSLVGPRPERPHFVREFGREIPEYHLRHLIPPGITGMAQIYGRYSSNPEEKLIYDLFYSKRRGPVSDIILLIKTIKVVMQRDKAV
ncbi:bacterial sugar transferase domain protein [Heliomicrobium modesticaldum Ice1]|uniref:Bacterial sugar transferase domain protein n=1 Tax=Heliobacterium modesticaldum (strain ATCC 51547 / Ice1) TaxID=498761 RepID=B0THJ9_HELMI|nr:sugar transferase [Heliomicrobium modesticaldum]ABZ83437.1 bacterial sugar transferase domain protein [Heliomicrobium modesticaldum Ice1]